MSRRAPLDLLDREFNFVQQRLLPADVFLKEAKKRGAMLDEGHLEALHLARVLQPLYRVARDMRAVSTYLRHQPEGTPPSEAPAARILTTGQDLRLERDAGRLFDPRGEKARRWRAYRRVFGMYPSASPDGPSYPRTLQASAFLYSPYQLLFLPHVCSVVPLLRPHRTRAGYRYDPPRSWGNRTDIFEARAAADDELVIGLSVFDTAYRWRVIRRVTLPSGIGSDDWEAYVRAFDAAEALAWLGWTPDRLLDLADRLLLAAHGIDPLGDQWHELVRLADPQMWDKLKGDALLAMDHRIAAEMLLLVYEDLVRRGQAPPLPALPGRAWHPRHDRLGVDHRELEGILTRFGLSPHPALVLVLEGETEHDIMMPRVMDLLGVPRSATTIQLVNSRGISNDASMLASYVTAPLLGDTHGQIQLLNRRPTRFLRVVDTEGDYLREEEREQKRQDLVKHIVRTLPEAQRAQAEAFIDSLVHVETWDDQPCELAHFSNEEIVAALTRLDRRLRPSGSDYTVTVDMVEHCRPHPETGRKPYNVRGIMPPGVTKVDLAEELWPVLEARIREAHANGQLETIPIARIALKARDEAQKSLRQTAFTLSDVIEPPPP